ncbi:MAG: helix-turn-helix domain-containing protein, partial [Nitrospirae bacterium]|nr:helix-turn-helix domain-containing protein [Nitrospirota bacterium]
MQTIGEYLKTIRQERGLSVEQVAGKTRISPIYIQALEENRLDPFPGEVFARGFVRVYGRCLGLDDQDTMSRFNQSAQAFFRERDENKRSTEQSAEQEKSRKEFQSRIIQVAIVATLALAILTVYGINTRQSEPPEEDSGAVSQPASETMQETSPPAEPHPDLTGPAVNKPVFKEAEPVKPPNVPSSPAGPVAGPTRPPAPQKPPSAPPEKPKEELPLIVNVPGQAPMPPVAVEDLILVIEAVES